MIDKMSTIDMADNSISHRRNKHIEPGLNFIGEQIMNKMLEISYCIELQLVDGFTKASKIICVFKRTTMINVYLDLWINRDVLCVNA